MYVLSCSWSLSVSCYHSFRCICARAILAEYSGAVLGVLSAVLYGRRGHIWKKVAFFNILHIMVLDFVTDVLCISKRLIY